MSSIHTFNVEAIEPQAFIFALMDDGEDENKVFEEMLAVADAGVLMKERTSPWQN